MVKRSRQDEEEVRYFLRSAGCAHTLDGIPIPSFCSVLERYTNVYGALLIGNELKANSRAAAYFKKYPLKMETIYKADQPVPKQLSLSEFVQSGVTA
ncbi:hypothetical protein [Methanolobus sp. ZRKC5]|uniref:hypothetical protein n=1 Tax=unclassified Methanolobus TaxID=2629569 RepID=UPI00313A771B